MMTEFAAHHIAMMAWSFATLSMHHSPLRDALSESAIRRIREGTVDSTNVLALVSALGVVGELGEQLLASAVAELRRQGSARDLAGGGGEVMSAAGPRAEERVAAAAGAGAEAQPLVLLDQPNMCLLQKPAGWTVTVKEGFEGGATTDTDDRRPPTGFSTQEDDNEEEVAMEWGSSRPLQAWVAQTLGGTCPIALDASAQHGLVHRLDRDTSGVLACAKTYRGFLAAKLEMAAGRMRKEYVCLVQGRFSPEFLPRRLEAPLRTVTDEGAARSVVAEFGGRRASTEVVAVAHLVGPARGADNSFSLVEVRLHTGRLHQIRAHLAHEGHPLVGDTAYGGPDVGWCPRVFLHAHRLSLDIGDGLADVRAALPGDLVGALAALRGADVEADASLARWRSAQRAPETRPGRGRRAD